MITVLIPAHNEAAGLGATLDSLKTQTLRPDRVVVICDNCTDDTEDIAAAHGATAIRTVGNTDKKAGALNQAFTVLGDLGEYVLVMDADTVLVPAFLQIAVRRLTVEPGLGAVGAVFRGGTAANLLELCQSNEYARYARSIDRTGRVMVLSGTAALIRTRALHQVMDSRGSTLPGRRGEVYERTALTEDNELTLALKTLGWKLASPLACRTITELMPTVAALLRQRIRWYRGALENLPRYGLTRVTVRYWVQQVMLAVTTVMMGLYLALTSITLVSGWWTWSGFWLAVGAVFWAERIITAWHNGPRGRLLAAALIPELIYDLTLMAAFAAAAVNTLFRTRPQWHHLEASNV